MGESVKLTNGKYVDTEGVYDAAKGETQSAINNRLGTVLVQTTTPASWTPKAGEYTTLCSLTLPDYGIWLVSGIYAVQTNDNAAAFGLTITDGDSGETTWRSTFQTFECSTALKITGVASVVLRGGRTADLKLTSLLANQTFRWGQDKRYWGLRAICIG